MPSNQMNRGLVALSASAIAAIYAAGYVRTQAADSELGAAESAPTARVAAAAPPTPAPPPTATLPRGRAQGGSQTAAPAAQAASASASGYAYKDGTYTGVGQSRRGGVQVAVAVQGGRIASVTITRVSTQYPASDIASLPAQVVARQSPQVDVVSGATYSCIAFRSAVQQALSQAQA